MERFCHEVKVHARSKSEIDKSIANGLLRDEQISHLWLLGIDPTRLHPDAKDPTVYPQLGGRIRYPYENVQLTNDHRIKLAKYLEMWPQGRVLERDIRYFKRCKVSKKLTFGSKTSQIRSNNNRNDYYVAYIAKADEGGIREKVHFGSVHSFVEVHGVFFAVI